jgi:hypothetical protein
MVVAVLKIAVWELVAMITYENSGRLTLFS